ncbi:MarR family transcriptional regulator [Planotetraspora silvatica]|uniref:MarR family transcriptional regulator n=1 Tax=Planotetraspora silvatica TaxID=234614 RepID=A0A8J3XTG4_9ACTN|nr:MarR family transcriptional regulator [Planotetraspora silvatica]GII48378.1 MarR family transcriptional regulator [Planotetraspora silvatica]
METPSAGSRPFQDQSRNVPIALVLGGGSLLNQVGRELRTAVESQLAPFDVTSQQAALLLHAARQEASPNQLAPQLGTDTAGMTRLLDRLEDKGLVRRRRHPGDRRSIVIEVTDEGRAIIPRVAPVFGRVTGRLLAGFSEAEVRELTGMLQRMLENLTGTGVEALS